MKKIFFMVLAVAFVTVIVAQGAVAEDRLTLNGSMRVQGFSIANPSGYYGSLGAEADTENYFKQRLRLGGQINVAEGVTANFRFDFSEGEWGNDDSFTFGRGGWARSTGEDSELQVDRAYLTLDKEMFDLTAGQYWNGNGNYIIWDHQTTGFVLNIKTPVSIQLEYAKMEENGSLTDETDINSEDEDFYGVNVGFKGDAFSANIMYATIQDATDADDSPQAIGLAGKTTLGIVTLKGELDYFFGSDGDDDYIGTQAYLDGSTSIADSTTLGLMFFYALGTDDAEETQRMSITGGGESFTPLGFRGRLMYEFYPIGSQWGGKNFGVFDPAAANAGTVGGAAYCDWTIADPLAFHAVVGYVTPQEDELTELDSVLTATAELNYRVMPHAWLSFGVGMSAPDYGDDATDDETTTMIVGELSVGF